MTSNPVFEKYRRQTMISALFEHERSLIREACAQAVARASDQPIGAIQAKYSEEEDRAIAWCAWLLNQCEKEFGGGLGYIDLDEPEGECVPRSRRLWASKLGASRMKGDSLWELLIAFIVGYIVEQLAAASSASAEREEFERELRKRLRLADEKVGKEEATDTRRVKSSTARAPAPAGRSKS